MPVIALAAMFVSAALAVQTPAQAPGPKPAAQTQTAKPGSLALTVRTENGDVISGARVAIQGNVFRGGTTGADGVVSVQSLPAGTYRCRVVAGGFVTLEKELTIRAGAKLTTEAVLSPDEAPKSTPTSTPTPTPESRLVATGAPGEARTLSIPDLAEQMLRETQPVSERQLGCSGATTTRLVVARENIALQRHADADEVIYLVAGEATLTLPDRDTVLSPGWFGLVPRGVAHSLVRRGRNPMVFLAVQSGVPCTSAG